MAIITPPFVQQGGSHPAATFRHTVAGMLGAPFGTFAGGVQPTTGGGAHGTVGAGWAVTQNGTPNMSVNVAGGHAFVRGTEAATQGSYGVYNDGTTNLVIAAANPTNPRRDLVCIRIRDAFYSGASTDAALVVVTGTPAASPADPTPPANSLVIARITVPAAATSIVNANITTFTTRAAALGARITCTSTTRPTGAALHEGLSIYELDTDRELTYDGAAWVLVTGRSLCQVRRVNTAQSVPAGTTADVIWDLEDADTDGFYPGTPNTNITIPAAGLYTVVAFVFNTTLGSNDGLGRVSCVISGVGALPFPSASWGITTSPAFTFTGTFGVGTTIKLSVENASVSAYNLNALLAVYRVAV